MCTAVPILLSVLMETEALNDRYRCSVLVAYSDIIGAGRAAVLYQDCFSYYSFGFGNTYKRS